MVSTRGQQNQSRHHPLSLSPLNAGRGRCRSGPRSGLFSTVGGLFAAFGWQRVRWVLFRRGKRGRGHTSQSEGSWPFQLPENSRCLIDQSRKSLVSRVNSRSPSERHEASLPAQFLPLSNTLPPFLLAACDASIEGGEDCNDGTRPSYSTRDSESRHKGGDWRVCARACEASRLCLVCPFCPLESPRTILSFRPPPFHSSGPFPSDAQEIRLPHPPANPRKSAVPLEDSPATWSLPVPD